jgi:hypothetical protein
MDPFSIQQLTTARHDDLVREADESRTGRLAREEREDARPAPRPNGRTARRLRFAG